MAAPGGGPGPFAGWSAPAEWSSFCASSLHPTDVSLHEGRRLSTSSYESSESVLAYLIEDEEEEEEAGQAHAYPLAPAQAEPALPHTAARLAQAPPASPPCDYAYRRVPEASLMGRKGAAFGFSAFAVSVGVSYFARLAGRDAELRAAAEACADFAGFVAGAPTDAEPLPAPLGAAAGRYGCGGAPRRWLVAVHLVCILLAAKNIDRLPCRDLGRLLLAHSRGTPAMAYEARDLELEVLVALRWRLGPFL